MAGFLKRVAERLVNYFFGIDLHLLTVIIMEGIQFFVTRNVDVCVFTVTGLRILLYFIPDLDYLDRDPLHPHTMLTRATEWGKLGCVRVLLNRGANVNARNRYRETALMYACRDDRGKIFDLLIERGADVNLKAGATAVWHAAHNNAVTCLHKLVALGASIYEKDIAGRSPLMIASNNNCVHVMNALLSYMESDNDVIIREINDIDDNGKTALMCACEGGSMNTTKILLDHCADINIQDTEGMSALMYAAKSNSVECVRLLLEKGVELDIVDKRGSTVFPLAVRGEGNVLKLLLMKHVGILNDGVLRFEHKSCILNFIRQSDVFCFSLKSVSLLLKHNIFDWNWFHQCLCDPLETFICPAIRSSLCPPGDAELGGSKVSALPLASDCNATVKFLLANRYFYPQDYTALCTNKSFRESLSTFSILDQLTHQPLSLKTWSFLTISKCVSLAGRPTERTHRVDVLPLPDKLKSALKFQTNITELCPNEWENLSINQVFDSLNFQTEIIWEGDLKCDSDICMACDGDYYAFKAHHES